MSTATLPVSPASSNAARPKQSNTRLSEAVTLVSVLLAASVGCFLFLNRGALSYDEAIYAQVAKETVQGNHWITLHWNGQPWFHKPPLYTWAAALLFKLFSPSEFLARLPSALAGVGCVFLVYRIGRQFTDALGAALAGLILITSALFTVNARQGMTDVAMTLFVLAALYGYLKWTTERRWWIIACLSCGLAVLTKGAAGLIAPIVIGFSLVADRRWGEIKKGDFWVGVFAFVTLAASWHILLFALHGRAFLDLYLLKHVIRRSTEDLHQYNYGYFFYFGALGRFTWPWSLLILPSLFVWIKQRRSQTLLLSVVVPLTLFTLARTKFSWYIVPILPSLAIMIAVFLRSVAVRLRGVYQLGLVLTVMLFAAVGTLETYQYALPIPEIQAAASLAKLAAKDGGAISSAPESLEMTVLYYSDRQLCADPEISPLSFSDETKCEFNEIQSFVFADEKRTAIESRFGTIDVIARAHGLTYGMIRRPESPVIKELPPK
jgi:4-amino-4-deoxy-L-arabinose transferase-like glycosyltransferase